MERVKITEVGGRPLAGYHFAGGLLVLELPGGREAPLECRCGRHHWLVVARGDPRGRGLEVKCHGCGTRAMMPLAPSVQA